MVDYIETSGNRDIEMDVFAAPDRMDFNYFSKEEANKLPTIEFEKIGLYQDQYRQNPPNKNWYRNKIKEHFANQPSFDEKAKYDPSKINDELYFNTGSLLMGL